MIPPLSDAIITALAQLVDDARLPKVSVTEAKAATEFMGVIAEYMLARHDESNRR